VGSVNKATDAGKSRDGRRGKPTNYPQKAEVKREAKAECEGGTVGKVRVPRRSDRSGSG